MIQIHEDPIPGGSTTNYTKSSRPQPIVPSLCTKGLSRRQRKNRRRKEALLPSPKLKKQKAKKITEPISLFSKKQVMEPLLQFIKFRGSKGLFAGLLHNYLMNRQEMFARGYPVEYQGTNAVIIYKNTEEFINKNECKSVDTGQGSGVSSDSGKICDEDARYLKTACRRCSQIFYTTGDSYVTMQKCVHHWGKLQYITSEVDKHFVYGCCQKTVGTVGCTVAHCHVWDGLVNGINGVYFDYVFTKPRRFLSPDNYHGVYALDCEMCYTVKGLEVTKVTVVGMDGRIVYNSYVRPDYQILDYNTRFSGITASDLLYGATKDIREVQNDLMSFITADTILIGHALENDLRALKIVHYLIVDTAYVFPHYKGPPYRRSLKNLSSIILKRDIQCGANGHSSYEDAIACMELMLWRVRKDCQNFL